MSEAMKQNGSKAAPGAARSGKMDQIGNRFRFSARRTGLYSTKYDAGEDDANDSESPMRISLCTTCRNRAYQLKRVFDQNLSNILALDDVEWVILNYNSCDDLHSFMLSRLSEGKEKIVYIRERSAPSWHSSIAKNIAHRAAAGDILMNLDCDNYLDDALAIIRSKFRGKIGGLHLWSGRSGDGTYGRIAVKREYFLKVGGYDESFYPMAYQDTDLLGRLSAMGVLIKQYSCGHRTALTNTKTDSILNCRTEGMTWRQFYSANRNQSLANLQAGNLIANVGHEWGTGDLEFFTTVPR